MNPTPIFGAAILHADGFWGALLWLCVMAAVWGCFYWFFFQWLTLKDPFLFVAKFVLGLIALVIAVNFLLSLIGHPLIAL